VPVLPIPSGTRDVLPDEMRELRAITDALRGVFDAAGYGEVATPALEEESVLALAGIADQFSTYRLFDEAGHVLVLRSDMTVPIARVVATRFADAPPPLRLAYVASAYRGVRSGRGQQRELLQAGIELVGVPRPDGTVEALTVLCRALEAVGLRDFRVALGSARLLPSLLAAYEVPAAAHERLLRALVDRDFVALEVALRGIDLGAEARDALLEVPRLRGGAAVLDRVPPGDALDGLRAVHERLPAAVAERIVFDLGLVRKLDYYTGAVFEVLDPALGAPLGRGGRYDELLGRFGRDLPAVGFGLSVDRLHAALTGEERR
jgi:ATP phosphoribosyltransferase regulatory subunit